MTTIFLVRHGEKISDDVDELNADGKRRAEELRNILGPLRLTHIFTSDAKRTQQMAAPLVSLTRLNPKVATEAADLVTEINALPDDAVVLIVGHSNTVQRALEGLPSRPAPPSIGPRDFDNLFVLSRETRSLITLKYGAPNPPAVGS